MNIKNLLQNFIEQKLEEMKQPYAVVDTADSNKVVATASDEKGAKQSIASSERPPMSIKDKNTLKIVKTRKKQAIGHPLVEEVELDEVSQALGHKVAKARQAQASQLRQKAVDEPDMMKAFAKTKAANTAEKKAGKSYNRLVRKINEEVKETATADDEQTVLRMLNSQSAEKLLKAYKKLYKREYPGTSKSELVSKIKSRVRNYKQAYELISETATADLFEDVHNDLNDAIIDFQKKLMRMTRQLDPSIAKEVKAIDKSLDNLRTGPLFKVRPGR